jgi:hypothetical protein
VLGATREYLPSGPVTSSFIVKNMLHAWNQGMSSLHDPRTPKRFMDFTADIEHDGFSDADKPGKPARLDASPLLGRK